MRKSKTTKSRLQTNSTAKPGSSNPKTQGSSSTTSYSDLKKRFDAQTGELREALEREAATGDILRMIARSPTELQLVLDGIAERAAKLCEAEDAAIFRVDGNSYAA